MKVSLHWLRRFVDFDLTATELAEKLTMRGFESEVVSDFDSLENLVVGDVLTAEKHPDACLLYTSPSPRDMRRSRMPSSA